MASLVHQDTPQAIGPLSRFDGGSTATKPPRKTKRKSIASGNGTVAGSSGTDEIKIVADACKAAAKLPRHVQAGYQSKSYYYSKLRRERMVAELTETKTGLEQCQSDRDRLQLALAAAEAELAKVQDLAAQERARLAAELDHLRAELEASKTGAIPITDRLGMVLRLSGFPTIDALRHWLDMPQSNFDNHLRQIFEARAQRAEAALNQGVQHA